MYRISEVSKLTNIPISTLRYYEKLNILEPSRSDKGYREYKEEDLKWISFIQRLKKIGMNLKDIKLYSDLRHLGDDTIEERMKLLDDQKIELVLQREELDEDIEFLAEKRKFYQELIQKKRAKK